jgi:hypothetical protein
LFDIIQNLAPHVTFPSPNIKSWHDLNFPAYIYGHTPYIFFNKGKNSDLWRENIKEKIGQVFSVR